MARARKLVLAAALLLLLPLVFVRSIEDSMIYFPSRYPEGYWSPEKLGLQVEDVYFVTDDGVHLHGWFAASPGALQTLVWCHGNAGNVSDRIGQIRLFVEKVGVNCFIFDYRGYGRSEGVPSEEGLYRDAHAAFDYLARSRGTRDGRIVIYGQSLGGAVAVDLAAARPCAGLVLEATFTSAREMSRLIFPWAPIGFLLKSRFDSAEKIGAVHVPLLMLHGDRDQTIPIDYGRRLFDAAHEPKRFVVLPGSDHNDTYIVGGQGYVDAFREYLSNLAGSGP
ncbi:MAG: alpha/beta hydrolase [Acidobacteria bacterium]|nr:alpha/beta hydrolase [Acidobacteriota bacterium]